MSNLRHAKNGTVLNLIRVAPGAKRTSVEGPYGEDALKMKVSAPPINGKANAEIERFLANLLPRSGDKTVLLRDVE